MDLITALAVGYAGWWLLLYYRSAYGIRQLDEGRVDVFMREINRDIASARGTYRTCLEVNKSAGYSVQGRYQDALDLLLSLNPHPLPRLFKVLYYNNLIYMLTEVGRLEDASRMAEKFGPLLHSETRNPDLRLAVRGTLAILAYHEGDPDRAERELSDLAQLHRRRNARCICEYYLGLISRDRGLSDRARQHFQAASSLAPWSHRGRTALELLQAV